jgi:hypothetical protein
MANGNAALAMAGRHFIGDADAGTQQLLLLAAGT